MNKYTPLHYLLAIFSIFLVLSCESKRNPTDDLEIHMENWNKREAKITTKDSLIKGQTYLSIYSQIYSYTQHGKHDLTTTVSVRNVSPKDSIYISKANYYNEKGSLIRSYISHPIYIAPLETVEIVIAKDDNHGGSGANFIFDWATKKNSPSPFFEAVMISTAGQQGLSFTTQGVQIK